MVPKGKRDMKTRRHGGRVVLSLDVEPGVRDALRERAALAGVSMAEYVSVALAHPDRVFATASAEIVQPLAEISYRISRALNAASTGDHRNVSTELELARRFVAMAMIPFASPHAEQVRSGDKRCGGGWRG